jgi:hypothetical protein
MRRNNSSPNCGGRFDKLHRIRTAGSQPSLEVGDKGKTGESRRRKATRLKRVLSRARPVEPPKHTTTEDACPCVL